jgi:hypothetical protein
VILSLISKTVVLFVISDCFLSINTITTMPIISSNSSEGGLGQGLIGEKIVVNNSTTVLVKELLGEGMSKRFCRHVNQMLSC